MSDEDFLEFPEPEDEIPKDKEISDDDDDSELKQNIEDPIAEIDDKDKTVETEQNKEKEAEKNIADDDEDNDDDDDDSIDKNVSLEIKSPLAVQPKKQVKKQAKEDNTDNDETINLNSDEELKKLFSPFRANGKDMQVHSVEDAVHLMQMGANYNKKMAAIKPNLKLMKMLENNDLLDENKLNYLIDLSKKDPEAVKKLVKESEIDTYDLDSDEDTDTEYTPNTYTVNDTEMELDGILDEIRDTQSFDETIDVISNKWDGPSRKMILNSPQIIKVINDHVGSGIYEQITQTVESERMYGRLDGISDLEAYQKVGDAIQAQGGFDHLNNSQDTESIPPAKKDKPKDSPQLKNRKRAAGSTRSKPGASNKKPDFNPLALSDEEFAKVSGNDFI